MLKMFFIGLGPVVDNQNTRILRFFIICNCKPNCSEEIVYFYVAAPYGRLESGARVDAQLRSQTRSWTGFQTRVHSGRQGIGCRVGCGSRFPICSLYYKPPLPSYWLLLGSPLLMDLPPPSQQHAGLHHAVWRLQQEVTRPKARFKPTSAINVRCQHAVFQPQQEP